MSGFAGRFRKRIERGGKLSRLRVRVTQSDDQFTPRGCRNRCTALGGVACESEPADRFFEGEPGTCLLCCSDSVSDGFRARRRGQCRGEVMRKQLHLRPYMVAI